MEYCDLCDTDKERLRDKSYQLLLAVTEIWGAEQGMILWDKIADGLGQDLKGELFFGIMTGNIAGDVRLETVNTQQAVPIIKAIRMATGLGLKDAKDIYDMVRDKGAVSIKVDANYRQSLVQSLRSAGCLVR